MHRLDDSTNLFSQGGAAADALRFAGSLANFPVVARTDFSPPPKVHWQLNSSGKSCAVALEANRSSPRFMRFRLACCWSDAYTKPAPEEFAW